MSFAIITDTSANLPTPLLRSLDIEAIPFLYYVNSKENACTDTEAFDGAGYYQLIREGAAVTTSQINPQRYIDAFTRCLQQGKDVLYIGMSSGISGSYHSAEMAAEQLRGAYPQRQIRTVDTLGASLGEGIPVLKAAKYRDAGLSLPETVGRLLSQCRCMYQVFIVEDLMHLRRTGRVSGVGAVVGTLLHINPMLKGNERGEIVLTGKIRGRKRALAALAEKYDTLVLRPEDQIVGIAHADCEEDAEYLAELLRRNRPPREILTVCYEPVTGSHVGPGTLALFFQSDRDVRGK